MLFLSLEEALNFISMTAAVGMVSGAAAGIGAGIQNVVVEHGILAFPSDGSFSENISRATTDVSTVLYLGFIGTVIGTIAGASAPIAIPVYYIYSLLKKKTL